VYFTERFIDATRNLAFREGGSLLGAALSFPSLLKGHSQSMIGSADPAWWVSLKDLAARRPEEG
jgi:hypothetical protein